METAEDGGTISQAELAAVPSAAEAAYLGNSRASWPAIWAGFFVGTVVYMVLTALGLAIGATWFAHSAHGAGLTGEMRTAGMVWLVITSLISFFVGGVVTGRTMGVPGRRTGAMNGFLYGAFSLILMSTFMVPVLAALPTLLVLFGAMGESSKGGSAFNAAQTQAFAWWTFIGFVVALAASALGGYCGAREAIVDPLTTGTGARAARVYRERALP
jgi:hypothetical protein